MPNVSIATYSVRVKRKFESADCSLGSFDGVNSLFDFTSKWLTTMAKDRSHDDVARSVLGIQQIQAHAPRITGILAAGEYGFSSDLYDIETESVSYRRTVTEAELLPFYMLIDVPVESDRGVLILQRFRGLGVFSAFTTEWARAFTEKFPEYRLDFAGHVPAEVLKFLLEGSLKSIRLKYFEVPDDVAERVRLERNQLKDAHIEVIIKPNMRGTLIKPGWVKQITRNSAGWFEVEGLPEADAVRITVNYGGKERTVDLRRPDKISPYLDVTTDVALTPDGHPSFESIDHVAREVLNVIKAEMGID